MLTSAAVSATASFIVLNTGTPRHYERIKRLDHAIRRTTQRLNLFDKVLIPRAKENIKRIKIYLSDMETAAVVRSKIAKRKRAATEAA